MKMKLMKVKLMAKVVLVTGGSRGIGKAIVSVFAAKGFNVVVNYVNSEEAKNFCLELENEYNIKT